MFLRFYCYDNNLSFPKNVSWSPLDSFQIKTGVEVTLLHKIDVKCFTYTTHEASHTTID